MGAEGLWGLLDCSAAEVLELQGWGAVGLWGELVQMTVWHSWGVLEEQRIAGGAAAQQGCGSMPSAKC